MVIPLYTFALIPMGSSILKLRIYQISLFHLSLVVSSRAGLLLIVSNIWKVNLAGLMQHRLKCLETGEVVLSGLKVLVDRMCLYILALKRCCCFLNHIVCQVGIRHPILPFEFFSRKEEWTESLLSRHLQYLQGIVGQVVFLSLGIIVSSSSSS